VTALVLLFGSRRSALLLVPVLFLLAKRILLLLVGLLLALVRRLTRILFIRHFAAPLRNNIDTQSQMAWLRQGDAHEFRSTRYKETGQPERPRRSQRLRICNNPRRFSKEKAGSGKKTQTRSANMLWTIFVILLVLWLLGMVSSYTLGGYIHILLLVAIVVVLIRVIQGRNPVP
jgi:hypothetical protein